MAESGLKNYCANIGVRVMDHLRGPARLGARWAGKPCDPCKSLMSKQFTCHFEVGLDKSVQKVTVSTDSSCFVCKDIVTKTTSKDFLFSSFV